ncbi:MAG TPA: hypothetical protein VFL31_03175 [Nitrospiraceae bacterium]|nr:hypothetical protein [Nitrospiraceae bacterium]
MWALIVAAGLLVGLGYQSSSFSEEATGTRPLLTQKLDGLRLVLPSDAHLLIETKAIEHFLDELDGTPPEWSTVYGHGHHDPGHDERLFNLNRERDAKREGKPALQWRVTFLWPGELSEYDPKSGGFRVAVGPKFNATSWGIVRFKPEEVPSDLIVVPMPVLRDVLRARLEKGEHVELEVAMTGRLIPEESIVYDFSHDEEGRGLIMPVVQIERIDYLISR